MLRTLALLSIDRIDAKLPMLSAEAALPTLSTLAQLSTDHLLRVTWRADLA
jgi:hypothetical protein